MSDKRQTPDQTGKALSPRAPVDSQIMEVTMRGRASEASVGRDCSRTHVPIPYDITHRQARR